MSENIEVTLKEPVMIKLGSVMLRLVEDTSKMIEKDMEKELVVSNVFLTLEICKRAIVSSLEATTIEEVDEIFKKETDLIISEIYKNEKK